MAQAFRTLSELAARFHSNRHEGWFMSLIGGLNGCINQNYSELGSLALAKGDYALAYAMFRAQLELKLSPDERRLQQASVLTNLARACVGLRRLYLAKLIFLRALAEIQRHRGRNNMQTVRVLCELAGLCLSQKLYSECCCFAEEAVLVYQKCSFDENWEFLGRLLNELCERFRQLGRWSEYERILSLQRLLWKET